MFKKNDTSSTSIVRKFAKKVEKPKVKEPEKVKIEAPKTVKIKYIGNQPLPYKLYGIKFNPTADVIEGIAKVLLLIPAKWVKVN